MDASRLKKDVIALVDEIGRELIEVSHFIHAHPELAFEERESGARLEQSVAAHGLPLERQAYGLDTAFASEFGRSDGPCVAVLAEYDALPGIGHACGHNVIAASALGAALALGRLGDALPGRVRFLGTPAEERGAGKERMARNGALDGVDAALMIHPASVDLITMPCIALAEVEIVYTGRSAHAAAMPHAGINALDALVLAYQAIAALRQHIKSTERIHGIITDGGLAPNIVPERAAGRFYVRAQNSIELAALKSRVEACFAAGAAATGATPHVSWDEIDYLELDVSWPLAESFRSNAEALGRSFFPYDRLPAGAQGSTDMGNVSHRVPAIHPMLACAPVTCTIHNPEFARWAGAESGDRAVLDGAKALAMTAIDFFLDEDLRRRVRGEFEASTQRRAKLGRIP